MPTRKKKSKDDDTTLVAIQSGGTTIPIPQRFVDVLGTRYQVLFKSEVPEGMMRDDENGCTLLQAKWIILDDEPLQQPVSDSDVKLGKKVLRHEIIHAFFYESGLWQLCQDENIVDWIAIQFWKMAEAICKAEQDAFASKML